MEENNEMEEESLHETETETSIGAVDREEQQDLIEHYTTMILRKLISDPYASVPEILETMREVGPFQEKQTIIQVFGGREILRKTISRMNTVRRAVLNGTLGDLPVGTRMPPGEEVGQTIPETDRFIESWAPWRMRGERHHELGLQMEPEYLFEEDPMFDDRAPDINRYPHKGEDTEGYLEDTESETDMDWETME